MGPGLGGLGHGELQIVESAEDRVEGGFLVLRGHCVLPFVVVPVLVGYGDGRGRGSLSGEESGRGTLPILMPLLGPDSLMMASCSSDIKTMAALNMLLKMETRVMSSRGTCPITGTMASLMYLCQS